MTTQLAIVDYLLEEASKLPSADNPLEGSVKEPGDLPVGNLLEEEWKLLRLVGHYHDLITSNGLGVQLISEDEKARRDKLLSLRKLAEDLVHQNIACRLGWKYSKLGFLEDGTIVSFIDEIDSQTINIQAVVISEPILLGGDKSKMN